MHVRQATRADIYDMGALADIAFRGHEFWTSLSPGMYDYPNDRTRFYRLRTRGRSVTKRGCISLVAVTDEDDPDWNGKEEISGYSFWQRRGTSEQAKKWQQVPWGAGLERALLWVETKYERLINRALDFKKWDEMSAMLGPLGEPVVPEDWHALVLAVSPKYERRGVGRQLVDWGKERAREDGVPIMLEATPQGVPLYEKCGFQTILEVRAKWMPNYVTTVMIWEPEGRQGEWLTESLVQQAHSRAREAPVLIGST